MAEQLSHSPLKSHKLVPIKESDQEMATEKRSRVLAEKSTEELKMMAPTTEQSASLPINFTKAREGLAKEAGRHYEEVKTKLEKEYKNTPHPNPIQSPKSRYEIARQHRENDPNATQEYKRPLKHRFVDTVRRFFRF